MEPRDLVGSARPKEAELQGSRAGPNEEDQGGAGSLGLPRADHVINNTINERWGAPGEGEGLEEQGEGLLEEQGKFSSFVQNVTSSKLFLRFV